ncbi:MAG: hypothetical protein V1800_12820 [Candidatus Latescibacterota bacterium]
MPIPPPIDLSGIRTLPICRRTNKVGVGDFARAPKPGASFAAFLASLPNVTVGKDFVEFVGHVAEAARAHRTIAIGIGGHVVKCGLSPVLIDLMERGIISSVALNGATAIHDTEIAMIGGTSEDVATHLEDGTFGMASETAEFINKSIRQDEGYGVALGEAIARADLPFKEKSILYHAARLKIPATVHVAIGTDIVHQHPSADGAAIGSASLTDFRIFCSVVSGLEDGVFINFGSTVILPEVFLKALTVARNLGHQVAHFVTANFDMIRHYRPQENIVTRPTSTGGKGYYFIGCHEIMIPLLAQAILECGDWKTSCPGRKTDG